LVSNSLKRINREFNTTIIMVSHHIDFIKEISTRAVMIEDGKLTMDGEPGKLCEEFIEKSKAEYLLKAQTHI
ncbi:MAG: ABC transporter ATP-binding protein, partial [Methanobacteriaceae archaeon]|nr:ABC transporter ATP-binding protein [Methanobacteriaceae archaeon]